MKPALKATLALPFALAFALALFAAFVYLFECYPIIFVIIAFLGSIGVIWQTLYDSFGGY